MAVLSDEPAHQEELNSLKLLLRCATVPALEPTLRQIVQERLMQPFVEWLGGEDAPLRAQIINLLAVGASLQPLIIGYNSLSAKDNERFRGLIARSIQRLINSSDLGALEQALDEAPERPGPSGE
jgi:hypothetical protein